MSTARTAALASHHLLVVGGLQLRGLLAGPWCKPAQACRRRRQAAGSRRPHRARSFTCRQRERPRTSRASPTSLYAPSTGLPLRRSEGFHNVGYSGNLDACLTERGWDQAHTLGRHVRSQQPTAGVQLVVVSPLVRALETAAGVFGVEPSGAGDDAGGGEAGCEKPSGGAPLLMAGQEAERNVRTAHGAVALPPGVKFLAVELCRERLGGCYCLASRACSSPADGCCCCRAASACSDRGPVDVASQLCAPHAAHEPWARCSSAAPLPPYVLLPCRQLPGAAAAGGPAGTFSWHSRMPCPRQPSALSRASQQQPTPARGPATAGPSQCDKRQALEDTRRQFPGVDFR